ncbi:ATP-binding protein [Helicobacter brantae]|nr:ATP-binding protein [Helicobacter brantae]
MPIKNQNQLYIKLPSKIITKLGGALYGGFIPAICETISNSYDADATLVTIQFFTDKDNKYGVSIEDNGVGMNWDTLKNSFFEAGKNRRMTDQGKTQKGRFVTGKKGLGKFALFGFCKELYIETSDGKNINAFSINISDLDKFDNTEYPLKPTIYNQISKDEKSYTKIILKDLLKKYRGLESIDSLARRINYVFQDQHDEFLIKLITPNGVEMLNQTNRQAIVRGDKDDDQRIIYEIPASLSTQDELNKIKLDEKDIEFINKKKIKGFLVARKKTTKEAEQKGVAIFSRGKICQDPSYFDIQQTNSYGYAHLYGELEIDFLDESDDKDYISTNRKEIEWDKDEMMERLRNLINKILKRYGSAYDRDKKQLEEKELEKKSKQLGIDSRWPDKYRLDEQTKTLLNEVTKMLLKKTKDKSDKHHEEKLKRNIALLQGLAMQKSLLNNQYVQNIAKQHSSIKNFYDEALQALALEDFETVIIKANAIRDGVRECFPNVYKVFTSAIIQYTELFGQNVKGALRSLLQPLQSFSQEKDNPIEELRSNTKTAHNTQKNIDILKHKYIAELVLNYVFMYAGFVLGNAELFSQSPDSLVEGQHSQSGEQ